MQARTMLFLGGARSGKSRLAQAEAEQGPGPLTFIATAQGFDDEMSHRIAQHRADRGDQWRTVEAPLSVGEAIRQVRNGTILVDCLTLWLSNLMLSGQDVAAARKELVELVEQTPARLIFVANEVGLGIVPETPLGRAFRDEAGRLNQMLASCVEQVRFVAAGLAVRLK